MEENTRKSLLVGASLEKASGKPAGLPDKFWDEDSKSVKINELLADYMSLISRDDNIVESNNRLIPDSYDKYNIKISNDMLATDEEILKRFHVNGFSNQQAQLVYDLAEERVIPYLDRMAMDYETRAEREKLQQFFGGEDRFNAVSSQIAQWAEKGVSKSVYEALSKTAEGVIALYNMMSSREPTISKDVDTEEELSEESLKAMMQDPRYWRDKDKSYIDKISKGFQKLYPSNS